jgi:ATP-dependent RNA helicase RhlE
VKVERIHGNRSQAQRTEALAGFKSGRYQVLVATDIAARGIDVTALGHVINFDVPNVPDDYIHRVGRTARAELTGTAFTLAAPEDESAIRDIERAIDRRLARVTVPGFDYNQRAPVPPAEPPRGHQHRRPPQRQPQAGGDRPAHPRGAGSRRPGHGPHRPPRDPRRGGGR